MSKENQNNFNEAVEGEKTTNVSNGKRSGKKSALLIVGALIIVFVILLGVVYTTGHFCGMTNTFRSEGSSGSVVACVNGERITRGELEERFAPQKAQILAAKKMATSTDQAKLIDAIRGQTLDAYINAIILEQKAEASGVRITKAKVDEQLGALKSRFVTLQSSIPKSQQMTFEEQLKQAGLSLEEYREALRQQMLISEFLMQEINTSDISVSEKKVKELYDRLAANPNIPAGEVPVFADVKDRITQQLRWQQARVEIQNYIMDLREQAEVEILI